MAPDPGPGTRDVPRTALLVLGVVGVAALPVLVTVLVAALLPGVGRLTTEGGAGRLLHLLWVYPVFAAVTLLVVGPVARRAGRSATRLGETVTEVIGAWVLLTALFQMFFEQGAGAAVAGVVTLAALAPVAVVLRRTAPRDDDVPQEPSPA
ncbi:hypothetical protein [Cellulomonas phragmiteti]|uniref:Uncharacterized protein n=1 Tax=Cellulomonas phragmiteti TaxID=478780 RepID=A0ABQ4DP43_9CELL|nr:hypothetical protein [Cellulomonas phragmiteti]GIG41110.1 hypothetical protein Cph01nite_28720 [Cellulomonas phragmiteti]